MAVFPYPYGGHHAVAKALGDYVAAASIAENRKGLSVPHAAASSRDEIDRPTDWLARRMAHDPTTPAAAGITHPIGNPRFSVTGITAHIDNDGAWEHLQTMAGPKSPRATRLYDTTRQRPMQAAVERIRSRRRVIHQRRLASVFSAKLCFSSIRFGPF
jgi:hypothetical protein